VTAAAQKSNAKADIPWSRLQGCRRLVCDQQLGASDQRHCDQHALAIMAMADKSET